MNPNTPRVSREVTDVLPYLDSIAMILEKVQTSHPQNETDLRIILKHYPRDGQALFSKNILLRGYQQLVAQGRLLPDPALVNRLQMKPTRTMSGVAPVTVLTKPYPCPGDCIFCPTDWRMPKSYLPDEPGGRRAFSFQFDPYQQTENRLQVLSENGHVIDKVELLVLGGTWSAYPRDYQTWFLQRCWDALNGQESATLEEAQRVNESASHRNVGLVIETRPDCITPEEVRWLRQIGVTKVQLGAQSLNDSILEQNRRGHTAAQTAQAIALLRAAGIKIALHWMPNLLGATPESDLEDFARLWLPPYCPDEIKIYPCSLLANAELYTVWQQGNYHPYSDSDLVALVAACKAQVPIYCRINRVYRDIPAPNIVAGSTLSNLRQEAIRYMREHQQQCRCIRCREVRGELLTETPVLNVHRYETATSQEFLISYDTPAGALVGYARLSLPLPTAPNVEIPEIAGAALLRELHVYGQAIALGQQSLGRSQHGGIGTRLLEDVQQIAREHGYSTLAVIAAIGTREYYAQRGFALNGTYMCCRLDVTAQAKKI